MKKTLTLVLTAALMASVFTGCGKSSTTSNEVKDNGKTISAPKEIGSADKPVKVSIIIKDVSPKEEDVKKLEEKMEKGMAAEKKYVDVQFLEAPTGTYKDAVPLAFRTGQISPDLIYFQGGDQPIANEGLLENLTPYIESSTNVKNLMEDHNKVKIKNYPYLLWLSPAKVNTPVMRKDLFDKLDSSKALIENPTPENYHKMFKELVAKGLVKYAITADGDLTRLDTVFNHAFGVTSTVMKVDGKWVFSKATKFERDKLEFYATLYKEGLIDKEYITKKWDTMEKSFYEGDAAFVAATAGTVINIYNNKMTQTKGAGAELVVLPPAKGVSQAYQSIDVTKESRGFAMSAKSEAKDAAWAVLEFMAGPEGRKLDKLGIEGVNYKVDGDKIVYTEKFSEWWPRFWETLNKFDPKPALEKPVMAKPAMRSLEMAQQYYKEDTNILIPEEYLPQWDGMNALYKEYAADIIRGVKPISAFDEFVTKWNAAGGNDLNKYLEEQFANK
ncbi:MAG: extracellular solute-binding protein [Clostridium lundense]|nr:extracellular solute-binding protein [Clostridium lundense]